MDRIINTLRHNITISKLFLLVSLLSVFLSSCGTSRKLFKASPSLYLNTLQSYSDPYELIRKNSFDFQSFTSKASINMDENSINASFRVKKDSLIWISITKFIELGRVVLTKDSLLGYLKIQDQHICTDYKNIEQIFKIPVNFHSLEALLLGNDFRESQELPKYTYEFNPSDSSQLIFYFTELLDSNLRIEKQCLLVDLFTGRVLQHSLFFKDQSILEATYSEFIQVGEGLFPLNQQYKIKKEKRRYFFSIQFSQPTINKNQQYPFQIPKGSSLLNF